MKIISWNMWGAFAESPARHEDAWQWLRERDADIVLLQEAIPPDWAYAHWRSVVFAPKCRRRRPWSGWGSAILARDLPLAPYRPGDEAPWLRMLSGGAVLASTVGETDVWFASLHSSHAEVAEERFEGRSLDGIRRCSANDVWEIELAAADLERVLAGKRYVVGGDLNSALLFDATYGGDANARLFENLRTAGFHDLRPGSEEQQTYFKAGCRAYQLDHVFADGVTARQERSWRVVKDVAESLALSDHAAIEIEVELPVRSLVEVR